MAWFLVKLIRVYQYLFSADHGRWSWRRPGAGCRYYPSCSEYTVRALKKYGFFKGFFLGCTRVLSCHPWSEGGVDDLK